MKKRVVGLILALIMIFSLLSVNVFAYSASYPLPTLTGDQPNDVANIAKSQIGYSGNGGTEYGAWWNDVTNWGVDYTYSGWCAMFACWCANKAGAGLNIAYDKNGASPSLLFSWLKNNASYDTSFISEPKAGDFVFFGSNGTAEHVAVVTSYDSSTRRVYFVGGNQGSSSEGQVTSSSCIWTSGANWGDQCILGYGRPNYKSSIKPTMTLNGFNMPSTVVTSDIPSLAGKVIANCEITWIWVGIDEVGTWNHLLQAQCNPMKNEYDISSLLATLDFASLSPGDYTIRIEATGGDKYWVLHTADFSIEKPYMNISEISIPEKITTGNTFTTSGTITSNSIITWVWMGVNIGGTYSHVIETQCNPCTYSYDISDLAKSLDIATLSQGDYTYRIEAISGNKYYVLFAEDFSVADEVQTDPDNQHSLTKTEAVDATCTTTGNSTYYTCSTCGKFFSDAAGKTEIQQDSWIRPAKGHTPKVIAGKKATCTESGLTEGSKCAVCGTVLTEQKEIPAKGHTPEAIAGKEATCTESGLTEGSKCAVCGTVLTEQKEIPAAGHQWNEDWISDEAGHWHACTVCGAKKDEDAHVSVGAATEDAAETCAVCGYTIAPPLGHIHTNHLTFVEAKAAACTEPGSKAYYVCSCGMWFEDEAAQTEITDHSDVMLLPLGHTPEAVAGKDATCTESGLTDGSKCAVCGTVLTEQKEIPAKGHTPEAVAGKDATCTESGLTEGSKCAVCGTVLTQQKEIPAKGHTPEAVAGKDATCTESGLTEGSKCAVCGTVLTEQKEIPAKGHTPEAVAGKDATCTESGLTEGSKCAVCGAVLTEQKPIAALGHSFTNYVYNNDAKAGVDGTETAKCDRCNATDTRTAAGTALPKVSFTDVPAGKYYTDAVSWAVANEITNGTSATTFSPNNACNRGQIVVFLWRLAGKPIAQNRNNPFTDVKEGTFCYEAVLWAAEQGITTGKTATTFCPAETCNRGQIVTFLWRYAGKPAPQNQNRQFVDVAAGSFCDQAVMWAVENQITLGVDATHFNPTGKCTRGHAVTFLYRGRELLKK